MASKLGSILVLMPTAGLDIKRLNACIKSVKRAGHGVRVEISLILCPSTHEKKRTLEKRLGNQVKIFSLSGKFNYCKSINYGIKQNSKNNDHILFINDDVTFTKSGDLKKLCDTLGCTKWACIGPYILFNPSARDETWPTEKSNAYVQRQNKEIRTSSPISGCCMLWDRKWLQKIGPLDEEFGIGWGLDEADLCLRATRLGGFYGRDDRVAIKHIMHASFGTEHTRYTSNPHMRNLAYFHKKHGSDVDEWGKSFHWWPLPSSHQKTYYSSSSKAVRFSNTYTNMLSWQQPRLEGSKTVLLVKNFLKDNPARLPLTLQQISERHLETIEKSITDLCKRMKRAVPGLTFSFSGSIVKDTFVWGISDIDILLLHRNWKRFPEPRHITQLLTKHIPARYRPKNLTNHITIEPTKRITIDLVPSLYKPTQQKLYVSETSGRKWVTIKPELFIQELEVLDMHRHGIIRPAIRLAKVFYASQNITVPGHEVELLGYYTAKQQEEINSTLQLLDKMIQQAPRLYEKPITDSSGQTSSVDHRLGDKKDTKRKAFVERLDKAKKRYKQLIKNL